MYEIGIPEINCIKRLDSTDGRSIIYEAESANRPENCSNSKCSCNRTPHKHSYYDYLLHDTKSEGKLVYIRLKVRRYRCPVCGNIMSDTFSFFLDNSHLTNRLRDEIVSRCIKGETFTYIARDYSIDHKTVTSVFKAYAKVHADELANDYTPEVLGIDEAHIDDHYRLVLTDVKGQRLLDIKRDNKKSTVQKYLKTLNPDICKCATMDFAPVYAAAVSKVLPDTTIVIDKFHVVQDVTKCMDNERKRIQNEYKLSGKDPRKLKRSKYLLMTNWEDLDEPSIDALSKLWNEIPTLYEIYMCKETFRDIYLTAASRDEAAGMLDRWLAAVPDYPALQPMKTTISKRKEHILNYWDYPWTNAYTESVNNIIKKIEKAGRGYKFDTLRERCIFEVNRPKEAKFNPRTAEYIPHEEAVSGEIVNRRKRLYIPRRFDAERKRDLPLQTIVIVYLEINDMSKHREDFLKRMSAYYTRITSMLSGE